MKSWFEEYQQALRLVTQTQTCKDDPKSFKELINHPERIISPDGSFSWQSNKNVIYLL